MNDETAPDQPDDPPMTQERSWEEFRQAGLLWFVNRFLHIWGWALVAEFEVEDGQPKTLNRVYPARCAFRGFSEESEERGFTRLRNWMRANADDLVGRLDSE